MQENRFHIPANDNYYLYKEKVTHGTPMLPLARYHTNISDMLPFCPIHWHEEVEIIKVEEGRGSFCIDGAWYTAEVGDILIVRPFVMHSINRLDDCNMTIAVVVFNLRLLGSDDADICAVKYFAPLLNQKHSVPCIVHPSDSWYAEFEHSVTAVYNCDISAEGSELDVKANLYKMFYLIYANRLINIQPNVAEDKRCYTVRQALEYIRSEYMNNITVTDIAKRCGYSEFYIMKLFKQFTGCSCVDYINNYRLTVAGRQLLQTDDDIATVAYQVGFNNVSYFNRQFKKQYGMTPKEFRNSNRSGAVNNETK